MGFLAKALHYKQRVDRQSRERTRSNKLLSQPTCLSADKRYTQNYELLSS